MRGFWLNSRLCHKIAQTQKYGLTSLPKPQIKVWAHRKKGFGSGSGPEALAREEASKHGLVRPRDQILRGWPGELSSSLWKRGLRPPAECTCCDKQTRNYRRDGMQRGVYKLSGA